MKQENKKELDWCHEGFTYDITQVRLQGLIAKTLLEIKELLESKK